MDTPKVAEVPYQFNVQPGAAVAIKALVRSFTQYTTGAVTGATGKGFTVIVPVPVAVQRFGSV